MILGNKFEKKYDPIRDVTINNCLLKTYLVGSMENPAKNDEGKGWRQFLAPKLESRGIFCFDPTKEESQKVGMEPKELNDKLTEWIKNGNWICFLEAMRKIWRGNTKIQPHPETCEPQICHLLGDIDFVNYSDFLIWNYNDGDKLGGTIAEIALAFYFNKPCYLITEVPPIQINKSLLYFVLDSGHGKGKIFKTYGELLSFLDGEYKLNVIGE